jgi:hypothetical protein
MATKEERPYGRNTGAWHQTVSKSDPCDTHGKASKKSQRVELNAPAAAAKPYERDSSKDEKTYDPREPRGKGDYAQGTRSSIAGTSTRANKRV